MLALKIRGMCGGPSEEEVAKEVAEENKWQISLILEVKSDYFLKDIN